MALFKIHKGDSANLDAQSRVEGYCWFTPDTGHFFIDTADARVPINATMYGVCNTAAATATKTVDITGFRLYTGARVTVKFTYASGASNSTLNVNGTGAKNMVRYGTTAIGNSSTLGWAAGAIQTFTYDGTSWVADYWQNTTYSNVALGQGYATCSTAAATAAKTATLSSYSLTTGGIVAVKFTYAVPANATLNINSKGAKNIYYRGAKIVAGIINAGDIAVFMYDGTQYQFLAKDYNNATTTTAGLMSAADKTALEAYKRDDLGNFSGKTIADLRTALENWANSVLNYPGATAGFSCSSWSTLWNAEDLTTTLAAGGLWLVTLESYYTANSYLQLKITQYSDKAVFYVARVNNVWKPANQVLFDNSGLAASQLPTSGVTAGTYGLDAAASPAHGGKFLVPKIVVDNKGRITSAAEYEVTLPADNNTDTKVKQTLIESASATNWYLLAGTSSTTTTAESVFSSAARLQILTGSTSTNGRAELVLGNNIKTGVAKNSAGQITLYSPGASYHNIQCDTTDSAIYHTLPSTTGTILNTGSTSATAVYTTGTHIATIKINGGNNKIYMPTASTSQIGGVKVGSNITVSSGIISLSKTNVTAALGYTPYTPTEIDNKITTINNSIAEKAPKTGEGASGNWNITAAKATADGSGNTITTKYVAVDTTQTISGQKTFTKLITLSSASKSDIGFRETRTGGADISFGVGSGDVNHGMYSHTLGKWMVYADASDVYLNGNAATATKLSTAFTLSLGTAASGSVTIDGSKNRTLSITGLKEAFLSWGGKAIEGNVSPLDAAMSSVHSANRFAFAKPAGIIIEYSNDAGATWNDYTTTDAQKIRLVSGIGSSYKIGGPNKAVGTHTVNDQVRVSLVAKNMGVYTSLQKILLNINTNYATGCKVKVEHSTYGAQTTFIEDGNYNIKGWSGWNSIPIGASFGSTTSTNWYMIRLTFSVTGVNSDTTKDSALTIVDITGHGPTYWGFPSSMAKTGHLYTYDENQAAIFAGSITVKNTSMYINGETAESVSNVGFQLQHNGNSIGKLFCSKAGTTSQGGTCQLVLGNAKGSTSNYNARGSIMMYSAATTGVTLLAHTIGTNYSYYFRDHDATIYSVGTSTRAAVGDESTPVYVNSNGFLTPCTSLSSGTDNEGNTISETYLKLTGGTVSGEVNSSANVATSSAAFRNIKVIAPGTEVIAGTTAIPTGEIWVRYEE